jgi:hypothetical protein
MKVEDLMIGDWVEVTNSDHLKYVQVGAIFDDSILTQEAEYESEEININDLQPIQLTEEILHNNGFKNDVIAQKSIIVEGASNFSVILISEDNRITINNIDEYLNSFNKWNIHIDTEDMRTLCTVEITYVHELQHILKFCKIEKEIVL